MEKIEIKTDLRYSLATLGGERGMTITAIEHSDDLATFLPRTNRGGSFSVIDHNFEARVADQIEQFIPFLYGFEIARFGYARIEFLNGVGRGNGRSAGGQYTANYQFSHVNPFTIESMQHAIDTYYDFQLSKASDPATAAV